MKTKALLLDIDFTIYDVIKAKQLFLNELSKKLKINKKTIEKTTEDSYKTLKKQEGYFNPLNYVEILSNKLNVKDKDLIRSVLWSSKKFDNCLFKDSFYFIKSIYKTIKIVPFSQGDYKFQQRKLLSFNRYINKKNIFIFKNKLENIRELVTNIKSDKLFILDDSPEVINKAKAINKEIITILIKRKNYNKNYDYSKNVLADYKVTNLISAAKIIQSK
ncbi:MAG: hypothetical protein WEC80_02085 [Patescibacteria group bacterium]